MPAERSAASTASASKSVRSCPGCTTTWTSTTWAASAACSAMRATSIRASCSPRGPDAGRWPTRRALFARRGRRHMSEAPAETLPLVAGRRSEAVFAPKTLAELRELMRVRDGLTLVPVGGGTRLELGSAPSKPFALVELGLCLKGELQHQADDLTVVTPAGATIDEINAVLAPSGQWL